MAAPVFNDGDFGIRLKNKLNEGLAFVGGAAGQAAQYVEQAQEAASEAGQAKTAVDQVAAQVAENAGIATSAKDGAQEAASVANEKAVAADESAQAAAADRQAVGQDRQAVAESVEDVQSLANAAQQAAGAAGQGASAAQEALGAVEQHALLVQQDKAEVEAAKAATEAARDTAQAVAAGDIIDDEEPAPLMVYSSQKVQAGFDAFGDATDPDKGAGLVGWRLAVPGAVGRTQAEKNEDIISVKDFGAVGDGVTDDTLAMDKARVKTPNIYLPEGVYYVTKDYPHARFHGPGYVRVGQGAAFKGGDLPVGTASFGGNGGLLVGGKGPGVNGVLLKSSGNPAWCEFRSTRTGTLTQLQIYSSGFGGLAETVAGTDRIALVYGSLSATVMSDMFPGMPIGFGNRLYRVKSVNSATSISLTNFDGTPVSFSGVVKRTVKIAYEVSEGTCSVSGTTLTWKSGDLFNIGYSFSEASKVYVNGVIHDVAATVSPTELVLAAPAGTIASASFKQVDVDSGGYYSVFRLQGIAGSVEDNLAIYTNLASQARIESQAAGGAGFPELVLGTGPAPEIPASVDFNTKRQHFQVTPTGETRVGAYFDNMASGGTNLGVDLYSMGTEAPKFGVYKYSEQPPVTAGTVRNTLARFGASWQSQDRALDVVAYNNFYAPGLQARDESAPVSFCVQPEGGNFGVGAKVPRAKLDVQGKVFIGPTDQSGVPAADQGDVTIVSPGETSSLYFLNPGVAGGRIGLDKTTNAFTVGVASNAFQVRSGTTGFNNLSTGNVDFEVKQLRTTINSVLRLTARSTAPGSGAATDICVADGVNWDPAAKGTGRPYPVFHDGAGWKAMI